MNYRTLEKIYKEIKDTEKVENEVNYISRLEILNFLMDYDEFRALDNETKRILIEGIYFFWIQSYYSIEVCEEMAKIIFEEKGSFGVKLRNNSITIREIGVLLTQNEKRLDEINYC